MVYFNSNSQQIQLIPTNIRDIIPKDHICYLIEELVTSIDYADFDKKVEGAGNPSYHPRIILKIILQGICDRITSSRKLEKSTQENIIYRFLCEGLHPNYHTIAIFRKNNSDLIKQCFLESIEIGKNMNLINFNKLYLDGTKIKANASKKEIFSKEEIEYLSSEVDKRLNEMNENDCKEDELYGDSNGEPKIPEHLTKKSKLAEKVKKLLKDIRKSKVKLDEVKQIMIDKSLEKINMVDSDSVLTKMKKGNFDQAYNCQLLVEDKGEFIVNTHISNSHIDLHETVPVIESFKSDQKINMKNKIICQDNGYSNSVTAEYYANEGTDAYIPDKITTKELHGKLKEYPKFHVDNFNLNIEKNEVMCPKGKIMKFKRKRVIKTSVSERWTNVYTCSDCKSCKSRKECLKKSKSNFKSVEINPHMRKIRLKFKIKEGREIYNKRFHKGEIAQAHILGNLGYREFRMRSMKSCENELNLVATAYNIRKIKSNLILRLKKKIKSIKKAKDNVKKELTLFIFKISNLTLNKLNFNHDTAC